MPTEHEVNRDEEEIVEKVNYLNTILIPSIKAINEAILNGKDPRDAAENLLSDIPFWKEEIIPQINKATETYNSILETQNKLLVKGIRQELKDEARKKINIAEKKYSRDMKEIIVSKIHKEMGLFQTRKKIEHGGLSLWELGEGSKDDE